MDYTNMLASHKEKKISLNPEFANIFNNSENRSEMIERIKAMDVDPDHIFTRPPALYIEDTYSDTALFSSALYMAFRSSPHARRVVFLLKDGVQLKEEVRTLPLSPTKASWTDLSTTISNLFIKEPKAVGFGLSWKRDTNGREIGLELSLLLPLDTNLTRADIVKEGLLQHAKIMSGATIDESKLNEKKTNRPVLIAAELENSAFKPTFISFSPRN